jgi:hypothetical protein
MSIDPYDDGIAIVLQLSRVAREQDPLLTRWLEHYGPMGQGFRNCGTRGEIGSREITLWADRVRDAEGPDAAVDHAKDVARSAGKVLPVAGWQVTGAETPAQADMAARIGQPVAAVRARREIDGDGERDRAAASSAGLPTGLRPSGAWVLLVFGLRFFAPRLDPVHPEALRSAVVLIGIALLHVPSRAWCERREHLLAALAGGCAAASLAYDFVAPNAAFAWFVRALSAVSAAVWAVFWMRRGRRD